MCNWFQSWQTVGRMDNNRLSHTNGQGPVRKVYSDDPAQLPRTEPVCASCAVLFIWNHTVSTSNGNVVYTNDITRMHLDLVFCWHIEALSNDKINKLRPRQYGRLLPNDLFPSIILIKLSLKFVPIGVIITSLRPNDVYMCQ